MPLAIPLIAGPSALATLLLLPSAPAATIDALMIAMERLMGIASLALR